MDMDNNCHCCKTEPSAPSNRRKFLNWLWIVLGGLACVEFGWLTKSILQSQQGNKNRNSKTVFVTAGTVDTFPVNSVTAIAKGQFHLARLADGSFLALSRTCTHLGCAVPWNEARKQFICPCHGSTFDINGEVLTPPATRGLDSYQVRIENGTVLVNIASAKKHLQSGVSRSVKV